MTDRSTLLRLDNQVVSDHAGWHSEESVQGLQRKAEEEAVRVRRGGQPLN